MVRVEELTTLTLGTTCSNCLMVVDLAMPTLGKKGSDTVGELRNVREHPTQLVSIICTGRVNSSQLRDLGALN